MALTRESLNNKARIEGGRRSGLILMRPEARLLKAEVRLGNAEVRLLK